MLFPELWDPVKLTFTVLPPAAVPRNYHSIALLLPDARVFSGGGGLCSGRPCRSEFRRAQGDTAFQRTLRIRARAELSIATLTLPHNPDINSYPDNMYP